MDELEDYEGRVYTVDARHISVKTLGKNFPNSPMLAAVVAVSNVMPRDTFIREMRASYQHKFAKKPEVIDGNMEALEMTFDTLAEDIDKDMSMSAQCKKYDASQISTKRLEVFVGLGKLRSNGAIRDISKGQKQLKADKK